jgi:hypothetical protein
VATLKVALGHVDISVTKAGFFPAEASLDVNAAREWPVEIELQPQNEKAEVTVYATRNDVRIQDSPLHVEVVSQDEINEELAMRPGDISMLLNQMGGMRVQTTSPALGAASVRVQGMVGRYTAFLSDGLPLFGQQGAGLGMLQIPPMDLAQVAVIKGNASALYGSAAMAGVVNLVSRRPAKEPIYEFLFNRSSLGETDGSMFLASELTPHWGASLLGGGYFQEHQDVNGDGWADVAGYSRGVFRPRFYGDNQNGGTALLTGGVIYEVRSGGTVPGAVLPATHAPYVEALKTTRYDLGGNVQRVFGGRFVVAARFSASEQNHRHQFGEDIERDRHELLFGELSIKGTSGRNTWVAGFADQRDAFRPRAVPRFAYSYNAPGLFAQDDFSVASWLTLSASARVDFHNRYGTFFSPRLSALLRREAWTSRISAGQGFFAPTPLTEETEAGGIGKIGASRSAQSRARPDRICRSDADNGTCVCNRHILCLEYRSPGLRGSRCSLFDIQPGWAYEKQRSGATRDVAKIAILGHRLLHLCSIERTGTFRARRGRAHAPSQPEHCWHVGEGGDYAGGFGMLLHRRTASGIQSLSHSICALRNRGSHGGTQDCGTRAAFRQFGKPEQRATDALGPVAVAESRIRRKVDSRRLGASGWQGD